MRLQGLIKLALRHSDRDIMPLDNFRCLYGKHFIKKYQH